MNKIIDIEERRRLREEKNKEILRKKNEELKLKNLIADMETILYLISKKEIENLEIIFKFREKEFYYGFREELNKAQLKERIDNIYKQIKFE